MTHLNRAAEHRWRLPGPNRRSLILLSTGLLMKSANCEIEASSVLAAFNRARHWLPNQGSLRSFVHHNTLHACEELPFFPALQQASQVYGANCLLTEAEYRAELKRERIPWETVAAVLQEDLGNRPLESVGDLGSRFHMRFAMLQHQIHVAEPNELRWLIHESAAERRFRPDMPLHHKQSVVAATRRRFLARRHGLSIPDEKTKASVENYLTRRSTPKRNSWSDGDWEACALKLWWLACEQGVRGRATGQDQSSRPIRMPAALGDAGREAVDTCVNDVLIRFTSAFVDQGFAHASLPGRDLGFLASFFKLYGATWFPSHPLLSGLGRKLARLTKAHLTPLQVVCDSLSWLELQPAEIEPYLQATLLALPGWAGMLQQLEIRPDRVAFGVPPHTLLEYLAVRLVLENLAVQAVIQQTGLSGSVGEIRQRHRQTPPHLQTKHLELAYTVYQVAQLQGWLPETMLTMGPNAWQTLVAEIEAFDVFQRCRIFQLVIETTYRQRLLNGLQDRTLAAAAPSTVSAQSAACRFQFICCIDDREESLRRYLEEQDPNCATYGYAGFFAVPMYFKGLGDAHYTPLCPIVVQPQNYVEEVTTTADLGRLRQSKRWRRVLAAQVHWIHNRSRSVLGGIGFAFLGIVSTIPLVMRVLFPRLTSALRRHAGSLLAYPAATHLTLEKAAQGAQSSTSGVELGFSPAQQVDCVARLLQDIGLTSGFARLVVICGHGSASLNNPHESAYNCGACGGGRGGPNARAFCQLANQSWLRRQLQLRGIDIPAETYFLGVFHNTCDDEIQYFDLDKIPVTHQLDLKQFRETLHAARGANAQERCRRFVSAPWTLGPDAALRHVQERAEDLSQTRPEYNHATNAACFVGRRIRTRGLFLDRRVFLPSYDPTQDDSQNEILQRILAAVVPVCAGINLEYFFSRVDPARFGCGSKLPHNVTALLGVMDGPASDLRTGLSEQMVEIHQPLRLLLVVETDPEVLLSLIHANPQLARLCFHGWVQVATLAPNSGEIHVLTGQQFVRYHHDPGTTAKAASSEDWYRGCLDHLEPAILD